MRSPTHLLLALAVSSLSLAVPAAAQQPQAASLGLLEVRPVMAAPGDPARATPPQPTRENVGAIYWADNYLGLKGQMRFYPYKGMPAARARPLLSVDLEECRAVRLQLTQLEALLAGNELQRVPAVRSQYGPLQDVRRPLGEVAYLLERAIGDLQRLIASTPE